MKSIRENVFETNSSSCHSLTVTSKHNYQDWVAKKVLFAEDRKEFVAIDKLFDAVTETAKNYVTKVEGNPEAKSWEVSHKDIYKVALGKLNKDAFYKTLDELLAKTDGQIVYDQFEEEFDRNQPEKADLDQLLIELLGCYDEYIYTQLGYFKAYGDYSNTMFEEKNVDGVDVVAFGFYSEG